jgi:phasin family protein
MTTTAADTTPKIDTAKAEAAAEKAYAVAADQAKAVVAPMAQATAATAGKAAAVTKQAVRKVAAKKPAAARKVAARKAAAPTKTAAAKIAKPAKLAAKRAFKAAAAPRSTATQLKDKNMAKTQTTAETLTDRVKDAYGDAQTRAKTVYDKSTAVFGEMNGLGKGNLEALVESGKILAAGLQDMGKDYVADAKSAFATMSADVKDVAGIRSPAELFKFQGEMLRRNFDAAVATGSKRSEAMVKLANEAFAPLSSRFSIAVDKVKRAA